MFTNILIALLILGSIVGPLLLLRWFIPKLRRTNGANQDQRKTKKKRRSNILQPNTRDKVVTTSFRPKTQYR